MYFNKGCILYEMYLGFPPFQSKKPVALKKLIKDGLYDKNLIDDNDWKDLISKLIEVDVNIRYGQDDLDKIKKHKFFKNENFDINYLITKKSPLIIKENNDEINYEPWKLNLSDQIPDKFKRKYKLKDFDYET